MTRGRFILEGREPIPEPDLLKWAKWMEESTRVVKQTELDKEVLVSTVFLGLDQAFDDGEPPVLFETLVFGGDHDGETERYLSWEEAERGHEEMLVLVQGK